MTEVPGGLLFLPVLVPLGAAFLLPLVEFWRREARVLLGWVLGGLSLGVTGMAALRGLGGTEAVTAGGWSPELGITLVTDPLAAPFLLLGAGGWGVALLCSGQNLRSPEGGRFLVLNFLVLAAMNGIFLAGDLFNLFVFYEIFSVGAYVLVGFPRTRDALEAGFKYLIFGTVGALFFLLGIATVFRALGVLNLALLAERMGTIPAPALASLGACILLALCVKMGAVPAHFWLPDAHSSADAPVSALLSGVLVKVSVYALIRVSGLLFLPALPRVFPVLLVLGGASVLVGHLMALQQQDLKRLLAYSTVAQIGVLLIGVGCATPGGIGASLVHGVNHGVLKMGLFLGAGVLTAEAGSRRIGDLRGVGRRRPVLAGAFAAAAAGLVGFPPFGGFWSKWFLLAATLKEGHWVPALMVGLGSVLSLVYYLRVLRALYAPGDRALGASRGEPAAAAATVGLVAAGVLLGILPLLVPFWEGFLAAGAHALDLGAYVRGVTGP